MSSSSITMEQLGDEESDKESDEESDDESIACCTVDGASPTAARRVADAFQPYFSIPTEVVTKESALDEALDIVETSVPISEILRKLNDSTDTTTRRKPELLLDNADRLTSKLQARNYRAHCQLDEESDKESDEESDDESEISDSDISDWE
jgi:hypothetical protein